MKSCIQEPNITVYLLEWFNVPNQLYEQVADLLLDLAMVCPSLQYSPPTAPLDPNGDFKVCLGITFAVASGWRPAHQ